MPPPASTPPLHFSPQALVFGAGYVGSPLALALKASGYEVRALTRNQETAAILNRKGVATIADNLESLSWHRELTGEFDLVCNTVGSAGGGIEGFRRSYLEGNRSIAAWAQRPDVAVAKYLFTGSVSVYPQTDGSLVDEEASTEGCGEGGSILLEAEEVIRDGFPPEIRRAVCRLAGIYGPDRHLLLDRLKDRADAIPGSPATYLNLIHRDDAVIACLTVALQLSDGFRVFNVSDGNPSTRGEIVNWLAEQLGVEPPPFDPSRSARPTAARQSAEGSTPNRRIDTTRIQEECGWTPAYPSFREGYAGLL